MNIFTTSPDPIECAVNLDDKRVRHMPKECFEMISMALFMLTNEMRAPFIIWNVKERTRWDKFNDLFNNKCTIWVASKRENIWWLYRHTQALLKEHEYRFDKEHYLKLKFYELLHTWVPTSTIEPSNWPNASGFTEESTIFDNYKRCLVHKWMVTDEVKPIIWTKRDQPKWIEQFNGHIYQGDLFGYNPGNEDSNNFNWEDDLPF